MSVPLLATKLFIPPPGKNPVDRPRLVNKLDECLHPGCRLALISAPAGFGKTTLASTWVTGRKSAQLLPRPSVAWLSLDHGDNDPVLFWSYVISSFQTEQEEIGKQAISLFQTTPLPDLEGNLASLVNDLAQILHPYILILDDFHLIRNPVIHRSLAFFIDHAPSQLHVIVLSRTDPPLPLALLRGRGHSPSAKPFLCETAKGWRFLSLPSPAATAIS